jgi:hypothetical protein
MLQMPRRSVTRFFVPLIDVLTLLFCIFLMMPAVKKVSETETSDAVKKDELTERQQRLAQREHAAAEKERELRQELDRLRRETTEKVLNGLSTRVFEIDPKTGELFYRDPDRVNVVDANQVKGLIRRDRDRAGPGREIYYVILYPREALVGGGVPSDPQKTTYDSWFADVPHRYDIPWESGVRGSNP